MPKTPKSPAKERKDHPIAEKQDEIDSWARDQEKHEYYYDDAHGYEKYEPEDDDED